MTISNYFSRCYASFNLSGPNGRVPVKKMDCETVLDLIAAKGFANPNSTVSDINYVSNVTITKEYLSLKRERYYDTLSHKKFKCYLECASESETDLQLTKCVKRCREIVDHLELNKEDRAERPPASSDLSGPILRRHFGEREENT